MSTDDMTKEERMEYWGMVVDESRQSGLTVNSTKQPRQKNIEPETVIYSSLRLLLFDHSIFLL